MGAKISIRITLSSSIVAPCQVPEGAARRRLWPQRSGLSDLGSLLLRIASSSLPPRLTFVNAAKISRSIEVTVDAPAPERTVPFPFRNSASHAYV